MYESHWSFKINSFNLFTLLRYLYMNQKLGMTKLNFSLFPIYFVLLLSISLNLLLCSSAMSAQSADSRSASPAVHIVYMVRPRDEDPEAYHIRTLASVVGSEEAAREALVYSYKNAASGFSARLTPDQVAEVSKKEGVLQVVPSGTVQLHSGPANLH